MTIRVSPEVENTINAAVQSGQFVSADEMVANLVREYSRRSQQSLQAGSNEASGSVKRKPIWERAAELRESIPAEEWEKLPIDGASQHDHYIYGTPKHSGQ